MYLKQLELHGFKSFAPRTVLQFSPGITAIVGPNGSGKSNIADAIRWVLGEQSMRQLRGKKSDDVIFVGGTSRAAMQMAEVGLVLDNSALWLPSEFAEVTVARRSFRSGDSEYLSNGQRVRLRDILLLLAQARIGHDSYTVIGQGMVDQALSARAEERRALFEDAAGIRQFQAQRTDAEQKLVLTQSNLARLRDILSEIEPRLAPLAEQARRAREYASAAGDLSDLLRVWYTRQWDEALAARDRVEATESAHEALIQHLHQALATREGQAEALRQAREELLANVSALRRERGEVLGRLQTTERDLAVAHERSASLERQRSDLEGEQGQQEEAIAAAEAHVGALEVQRARAEAQAGDAAAHLDVLGHAEHSARQEQEREEARLRAAQRDGIQVQARLGAAQTELGRLQRQLGEHNRTLATRREQVAQARGTLEHASDELERQRQAFDGARAEVEGQVAQREQLQRELADGQAEIERLRAAVADGEREQRALADRLALYEEWRRTLAGFGDGVRALLRAPAESRPPILGTVAQLIAVPAGFEAAIEAALGPHLHGVLVASREDARQAAHWLWSAGAGQALFIWQGQTAAPPHADTPPPALPTTDGDALLGYARAYVTCDADLRPIVDDVLGDTLVVRDLAAADARWPDGPPVPVVTRDGQLWHPRGWLRGGAATSQEGASGQQEASILARERELRQLPTEIERLGHELAELRTRHRRAGAAHSERAATEARLRHEIHQAEARAQEAARALTATQREHERAAGALQLGEAVAEQLTAEVRGIEQEVAGTTERVAEQERAQQEATERIEDIQAAMDELVARNRAQQDELTRARTAVALHQQEIKGLDQRIEQMRAQAREIQAQLGRRGERLRALAQQRAQLDEGIAAQSDAIAQLRAQAQDLSERLRAQVVRQGALEDQAQQLERGQSGERQELARVEVEYRQAMVEAQRARDAVETLRAQISEELGASAESDPPEAMLAEGDDAPGALHARAHALSTDDLARLRRQIEQLRVRLKHLGGYDAEAPQAYEELKTRYDFLTGQVRDMEQALANLRSIITELDASMRRQFEETFHAVNERFQRHFITLFSGGAARLELTAPRRGQDEDGGDENEELDPGIPRKVSLGGIEIFVQIPGKRVQDLVLLSGGERAMVSVALLFALLETNPPPFCLLDEVDAALDEANVVRFCDILRILAEHTQFIVITHNRVTMTHATAIYGISMGSDSVSRVLSMRLAEVTTAH